MKRNKSWPLIITSLAPKGATAIVIIASLYGRQKARRANIKHLISQHINNANIFDGSKTRQIIL